MVLSLSYLIKQEYINHQNSIFLIKIGSQKTRIYEVKLNFLAFYFYNKTRIYQYIFC